jgi:hypothetical protein
MATVNTMATRSGSAPLFLRAGFWVCVLIAVAVVVRRVIALARPPSSSAPPQLAGLDAAFASHAVLTLAHILPALLFVLLAPVALSKTAKYASLAQSLLFPLGVIVGITAYAMSAFAVGGWVERSAVLFFDTLFLICLWRSFEELAQNGRGVKRPAQRFSEFLYRLAARSRALWAFEKRHDATEQRRWLLRAIVILLGIATTRPVMGVFFATSRLTHLQPQQFFGIAFWIGFSINTIAVELWLRRRKMA